MNKRVCKEDQIKFIMECRQSGFVYSVPSEPLARSN